MHPLRRLFRRSANADRLTRITGSLGSFAREDIIHDTNGNRLRVERRTTANAASPSQTDTYVLAPGTNRLTGITGAAGNRAFSLDARGNLITETRSDGTSVTVTYDGRGRLVAYTSGGASQTMTYNGADERVRVVTTPASGPADTRVYVYDLDHRIIGEYGPGGNGDVRAEYIWTLPEVGASGLTGGDDGAGGYMPLAVVVGSGASAALRWVHGDHMGVPLLTTDATGAVVTPTGYALSGFPGQFANAVLLPGAAHYTNRYRDYDPTTGRYIQADPIGLAGDPNPYAYALGNPLRYTDPTGEAVNLLIGAAAGVGTGYLISRATGGCYSLKNALVDAALGATGAGLIARLGMLRDVGKLRALARERGLEPNKITPHVEDYINPANPIEGLKIKHSPSQNASGPLSGRPRAEYRVAPGTYQNPFTGAVGRSAESSHVPIGLPSIGGMLSGGVAGGALGQGVCGCRK